MTDPSPDSAARALFEMYRTARDRQRRFKQIGRVLTLVFLGVIAGFLFALFGKVRAMYAPENFEAPLEQEAMDLVPKLRPELELLVNQVTPVYADMAREKFEAALPTLEKLSYEEKEKFIANLSRDGDKRVNAALDRVRRKHEPKIREHFPTLMTPEGAEEFRRRWQATIEEDTGQILLRFYDRYTEDLGHVQATLERFRPNRFEDMREEELSRYFVHLWLVRLDRMIWLGDEGEALLHGDFRKITDEE